MLVCRKICNWILSETEIETETQKEKCEENKIIPGMAKQKPHIHTHCRKYEEKLRTLAHFEWTVVMMTRISYNVFAFHTKSIQRVMVQSWVITIIVKFEIAHNRLSFRVFNQLPNWSDQVEKLSTNSPKLNCIHILCKFRPGVSVIWATAKSPSDRYVAHP